MATLKDLRGWMVRDLLRPNIQIKTVESSSSEKHFRASFFTATNEYCIHGLEREDGQSYLGCVSQCRRARPGEDWNRGNDLPDGELSEDTWHAILAAVVQYEVQQISSECRDNENKPLEARDFGVVFDGVAGELPRYKCHKEVHALKIKEVDDRGFAAGGARLVFEEEGFAPIDVSEEYMRKHQPKVGGYYVVYEDDYESWSPGVAFKRGYTRIN